MENKFTELRTIDVGPKIEKKNGLSYLSWAYAVDTLLQNDPRATWQYGEDKKYGESVMVFCTVTAFGKSMTAQLPVMDYRNQAIQGPNAFQVNTAMQRCLAKAIALHGIGLYIYAGEDLPQEPKEEAPPASILKNQRPKRPGKDFISHEEQLTLHRVAKEKGVDMNAFKAYLEHLGIEGTAKIEKADYQSIYEWLLKNGQPE